MSGEPRSGMIRTLIRSLFNSTEKRPNYMDYLWLYMSRLDEFEGYQQIAYIYRHGAPLIKPELVKDLPTKIRRLHKWHMQASAESKNWIYAG
jgi:hypothetical protein